MADRCFAIYLFKDQTEKIIYNLDSFNVFIRWKIKEFVYATAKEVYNRTSDCELDLSLKPEYDFSLIGYKYLANACFIFIMDTILHEHILLLSKAILFHGMKDSIEENFEYIKTETKCQEIKKDLVEIKTILINNIELLLEREEKLEEVLIKTEYLKDSSKKYYDKSKKLNKCCWII